jgi:predicted exporter
VAAFVAWSSSGHTWLRSNVFELLPASEYDPLTQHATQTVEREIERQLLFLIGHEDRAVAKTAAIEFASALSGYPLIERVQDRVDPAQIADAGDLYFAHRARLLSAQQIESIERDGGRAVEQSALAAVYSPLGNVDSATLLADPFSLFAGSLRALQPPSSLTFDDGFLWTRDDAKHYVFIAATAKDVGTIEQQRQLSDFVESLARRTERESAADVLATGFVLYANAGTQSAQSEITLIGLGSILGVVLLIIGVFRSVRPLVLGVLSIASGCALALAVTLAIFGSVHLFTLVFGASLIGVSIDYSLHYVAQEALGDPGWSSDEALERIFPGITLGLITSVIAFLALTVAPFPGLKQLAAFSSAGLIGAYATLLCCAGLRRRPLRLSARSVWLRASDAYLALWRRFPVRGQLLLVAALAALAAIGIATLRFNDDVSILQTQPKELKRQEAEITRLLHTVPGNAFALVRAETPEAVLETEETLREHLDALIARGELTGYQAISRAVPSAARQARSLAVYRQLVRDRLPDYFRELGVADDEARAVLAELLRPADTDLTVDAWLAHDVSEPLRGLWLDTDTAGAASIVLLEGLADAADGESTIESVPGVRLVHRAHEVSALFGAYRARVAWLLGAAYLAIYAFLALRYGARRAASLLLPPVLAGLLALATVSFGGAPLNLFNLLGLILVLGIGIDFTLFIAEADDHMKTTMFAVTLSAATTLLSFGLLALSTTYAVRSFGSTVLIGIALAYLLAPFAQSSRARAA